MIEKPNEFLISLVVAMAFVYSRMSHLSRALYAGISGGPFHARAIWRGVFAE